MSSTRKTASCYDFYDKEFASFLAVLSSAFTVVLGLTISVSQIKASVSIPEWNREFEHIIINKCEFPIFVFMIGLVIS